MACPFGGGSGRAATAPPAQSGRSESLSDTGRRRLRAALRGATARSASRSTTWSHFIAVFGCARAPGAHQFLAGGACRAATSPSARSGRNGPPRLRGRSRFGAAKARTAVAPLCAALLVAARRVPPQAPLAIESEHCVRVHRLSPRDRKSVV